MTDIVDDALESTEPRTAHGIIDGTEVVVEKGRTHPLDGGNWYVSVDANKYKSERCESHDEADDLFEELVEKHDLVEK